MKCSIQDIPNNSGLTSPECGERREKDEKFREESREVHDRRESGDSPGLLEGRRVGRVRFGRHIRAG
jgi:hypothetical protein